jgi:peptide/nickel transport system substrate-binding protein
MMKRAQRQAVLAAIARREWLLQMLALGAAGCGRGGEDRAYSHGNTLIAAVAPSQNDRPLTPDTQAEFLVYLPLVRIDEHGERQPCLATEWKHSADYLEWTYRLRPGVRWHDGRPVTVDDVKFTIDLHGRPDSDVELEPFGHVYGWRTECTVHDESTFTVRGIGWTRWAGADSYMSVVPKHLLKDLDYQKWYEWDFWLRPVGNGPYRYLRYQPGTMVELEANPEYYKGKPKIERVVLKFSGRAGLTELLSGNVDAIEVNDSAQLSAVANDARFQTYCGEPDFWNLTVIV